MPDFNVNFDNTNYLISYDEEFTYIDISDPDTEELIAFFTKEDIENLIAGSAVDEDDVVSFLMYALQHQEKYSKKEASAGVIFDFSGAVINFNRSLCDNFIYVDKQLIALPNHDFTLVGSVRMEKKVDSTLTLSGEEIGCISDIQISVPGNITKKIKSIDIVQDTVVYETSFERLDVPVEIKLPVIIETSYREFLGLMTITLYHSFQELYRIFIKDEDTISNDDIIVDSVMDQVGVI